MSKKTFISIFSLAFVILLGLSSCKDECKDVVCQNGGTCIEGTCECADGYEGTNCETEERAKYFGDYTATETSGSGNPYSFDVSISANSSDIFSVDVFNFNSIQDDGGDPNELIYWTISGEDIQIPNQELYTVIYEGSGTIDGNTITLDYTGTSVGSGSVFDYHTEMIRQ